MKITLRQLKVFLKVANCLSYTRASELLHMSQPAVSKQIKQLEDETGILLFEKMGKKIYLTEAGGEMLKYSESILAKVAEAKEHFAELRDGDKGRLKIAAATTAGSFVIEILGKFRKLNQDINFEFDVNNRQTILSNLDHNQVDLVIMGVPPENPQYKVEAFMENPLVFIAPLDHSFVTQQKAGKKISAAQLVKERFVVREEGSGTRSAIDSFFAEQDLHIDTGMIFNSNESIKKAVASGFGIGLVSTHTIQNELKHNQLAVLKVENTPLQRYWYLVHLKEKRFSTAVKLFKDFVLEHGKTIDIGINQ